MADTRVEPQALEKILRVELEKDIISSLGERLGGDSRKAMDIYYHSRLAEQIDRGDWGIQYLDSQYLVEDLFENESALFKVDRGRFPCQLSMARHSLYAHSKFSMPAAASKWYRTMPRSTWEKMPPVDSTFTLSPVRMKQNFC
jgi:hypothetical protein